MPPIMIVYLKSFPPLYLAAMVIRVTITTPTETAVATINISVETHHSAIEL